MQTKYWVAPNLATFPELMHGFSYRTGGVSTGAFASLNLGLHVSDGVESVCANRARLAAMFGRSLDQMICAEQVHGGSVAVVGLADQGRGARNRETAISGVDALVTQTPGPLLTLFFADCVPVFLFDPEQTVIAIAHAGWRGLVAGVLENTITTMVSRFGTRPSQIEAAIGPCIGPEWFEVGDDVAARFPESRIEAGSDSGRPHVDLVGATSYRLLRAGILPDKLAACPECTASNPHRYFSHRRDHGITGRMGALITLNP